MAKKNIGSTPSEGESMIRFHPLGLTLFAAVLVLAGGLLGSGLMNLRSGASPPQSPQPVAASEGFVESGLPPQTMPPWGELMTYTIWLERPEEYVAAEAQTNQPPTWAFDKLSLEKVRNFMVFSGMMPEEVNRALTPERTSVTPVGTTVRPSDDLVFELAPRIRAALYRELARNPVNRYIATPLIFQGQNADEWFAGSGLDPAAITLAKKLVYPRGQVLCLSDPEVMMRALHSEKERIAFLKAASRQPSLLARLRIRPDTDVDKILGYWSRGVQVRDARPLMQSVKRLPDGGSISLIYMLPRFARDRLYTFPRPPGPGDPLEDCHWSTLNFFTDPPDNRFCDTSYTVKFIQSSFYSVAKPTSYGDIVLVVAGGSNVIHSAVFLADDIVFTKNGNNVYQPWTLMRIKDLMGVYDTGIPLQLSYYRRNNW